MSDLWRDWPHRWFGYFCWEQTQDDDFPSLRRLIDPSWKPADLPQILGYLLSAPVCWCTQSSYCPCDLCGEPLRENATAMWDGLWLWPYPLIHDVERHNLRLPEAFVERIRSLNYIVPQQTDSGRAAVWGVNAALNELLEGRDPRSAEERQLRDW